MNNNWYLFYVSSYKGGELQMKCEKSVEEAMSIISRDYQFIEYYKGDKKLKDLSDDKLLNLWKEWYEDEDRHNRYAYDSYSEIQVYRIKDNKLVSDFPSNEQIIECIRNIINE